MFKLAFLNILRNKGRLVTGVSGTVLAVTLILIISGFGNGMFAQVTSYVERNGADIYLIQEKAEGMTDSFVPASLEKSLAKDKNIEEVTSIYAIPVIFDANDKKTTVVMYGYKKGVKIGAPWKLASGRMVETDDEIILDEVIAKLNGLDVGKTVKVMGREFKIAGLSAETNAFMNTPLFVSYSAASKILNSSDKVNVVLIKAKDSADINKMKEKLKLEYPGYKIQTREEVSEKIDSEFKGTLGAPLNLILGISFLVGIMLVGLTSHILVLGMSKEYGVLKAVGAKGSDLYKSVILETIVWIIIGFTLGIGLSKAAASLISRSWPELSIVINSDSIIKAAVMIVVIGIISVIWPIRKINKIDPARVF